MFDPVPFEIRKRAIDAAQSRAPFDLLLRGARIANVATMEIYEADIGIVGPMIASVHAPGAFTEAKETHDLAGLIVTPGFIDGHVHVESSHMLPHHYASVVVPQGTTTIFWDPHELANVIGLDGIRYAIAATRNLPLRFIVQASSCVPAAPGLEISGADFKADDIRELMSWPDVAGLAEVMDMRAVLEAQPRMMGILEAANASGKIIEGHARELTGPGLMAYLSAGISADHEIGSGDDALEKLRAGFTVEIRGSHDNVLPGVVEALNSLPVIPTNLTICTDDVFPDYLVAHGGINDVLRRLIRYGLDPLQAIRCATINNAIRLRRDDLGLVAAGRKADLVALSDLREVKIESVYSNGRHVAKGGRMIEPVPAYEPPLDNTMKVATLSADDFRVRVLGMTNGRAVLQTIKGARFNSWSEVEVEVRDGFAVVPPELSVMAIVHRHGRNDPKPQVAIIEGWERWRGAFATSYSHDSHNLIVYGHDAAEMALAANTVIGMKGGTAVVKDGEVAASLAYPVAGMLSLDGPEEVGRAHKRIVEVAGEICAWQPPYRTFKALSGQSLACNPGPHLTDLGLTDGTTKDIRPTLIRAL
ncbi:adenine deaminase [Pseudorhodoplanes sinuspersici]|uniref:Adenine deaminase n=1 Tax=Pseudorhodoplanes sinuspersici TaxID=1235591 RepID=A0A1W6ZWP5_9HYPH|nr:adenine deaminase C-terminal domain-containing protein [Pseudorhodoplanes sinuspersici]ARQ01561.1 adenosine deaminase [Pseudorhodoplanes sinuspersici]RKE73268.1 adenine deaminase [Pseudorhodoplanes sinuspersici]